jgi:hypothetical protein
MRKDGPPVSASRSSRAASLAVACGSVGGLDLGKGVKVRSAWEELQKAEAVFQPVDEPPATSSSFA